MSNETFLKLSAVGFAGLWCLLMWLSAGLLVAAAVPLAAHVIFSVLVAALCSWLYGKWFLWFIERAPLIMRSARRRALAANRRLRRIGVGVGLRPVAHA